MNSSTNLIGGKQQSEDWDDTAILNSFESGITSFRTKNQSKPQVKNNTVLSESAILSALKETQPNKRKECSAEVEQRKEAKRSFQEATTGENQPSIALLQSLTGTSTSTSNDVGVPSGSTNPMSATSNSSGTGNDEALQSMLMAWYYSGYATGRYQALKEVEEAAGVETRATAQESAQSTKEDGEFTEKTPTT